VSTESIISHYESESINLAKEKLLKRGIDKQQKAAIKARIMKQTKPKPLSNGLKILFLLAPGMCIWYMMKYPEEWKRVRADARKFLLWGMALWAIIVGLLFVP
jgi:hypothetical protein